MGTNKKNGNGKSVHAEGKLGMINSTNIEDYKSYRMVRYYNPLLVRLTGRDTNCSYDEIIPADESTMSAWRYVKLILRMIFGRRWFDVVTESEAVKLKKKYGAWIRVYKGKYYSEDTFQKILSATQWNKI